MQKFFSRDPKNPTLKAILSYDIIAFKNCYPTTKIISDAQLEEDKKYYTRIHDSIMKLKNNIFVLLTPPPLREELTKKPYAKRAKNLVEWLTNKNFTKKAPHIHVFNLFSLLANENGMLKKEYARIIPLDSHPNRRANEEIARVFADYLVEMARKN